MESLSALAAIVVIDLVLAGDNAIVIALAARNLPKTHQRRAVVWGTLGAIAVRASLTVGVLWLLALPGLSLAGGALLAWIAYRLLVPEDGADRGERRPVSGFWAAMRTIVIADAVMGLDNVLGVAGAARGNALLVVLGLLISVPIMVWGSSVILRWIERFPALLYVGGAVLAWTAATMIVDEPVVAEALSGQPLFRAAIHVATIAGVLGLAALNTKSKLGPRLRGGDDHSVRITTATPNSRSARRP